METENKSVRSRSGIVTCPHYLAAETGAEILRQGGNAVDAAIATQAVLSVVYPHMTGLGGDAFWLIYQAQSDTLIGLNGSGRAARQANLEAYVSQGYRTIPHRGPLAAITVPGAVASWQQAHQRFGQRDWGHLLEPAIALAEQGYPITGSQVYWTRRDRPHFDQHSPACPFLPAGWVPNSGERITNPDLGKTLRQLAREGATAFYQGAIATQISDFLQSHGGLLTAEDFAHHTSTWVTPITTTYRGYEVVQLPPNSQGLAVLQMLNWIEPFDLSTIGHGTADYYHLMVEATKRAFQERDRWLSDPDFVDIPLPALLDKGYCDRHPITLDQVAPDPGNPIGGDTVYTAIVDGDGNAVSVIQSVYFDFGSAVVVPGTGFVLHNRGCFFSLKEPHVNCLMPGKRPFHTLMPGMVLTPDRKPYLVLGTMGGEGQPQTQLALITRMLDFDFDPQAAINEPRWLWGRTWGEAQTGLTLEGRIPAAVGQNLTNRGHPVRRAPAWTEKMGHAHVIRICPETGIFEGGCDPRSDGRAIAP